MTRSTNDQAVSIELLQEQKKYLTTLFVQAKTLGEARIRQDSHQLLAQVNNLLRILQGDPANPTATTQIDIAQQIRAASKAFENLQASIVNDMRFAPFKRTEPKPPIQPETPFRQKRQFEIPAESPNLQNVRKEVGKGIGPLQQLIWKLELLAKDAESNPTLGREIRALQTKAAKVSEKPTPESVEAMTSEVKKGIENFENRLKQQVDLSTNKSPTAMVAEMRKGWILLIYDYLSKNRESMVEKSLFGRKSLPTPIKKLDEIFKQLESDAKKQNISVEEYINKGSSDSIQMKWTEIHSAAKMRTSSNNEKVQQLKTAVDDPSRLLPQLMGPPAVSKATVQMGRKPG